MSKTDPVLRVTTPMATLSFPALFEPKAMNEGDEPKYSAELIFPEGTNLDKLKAAAKAAAEAKFGKKLPAKFKWPWRDGSTEREGREEYADRVFIGARSKSQPRVIVGQDMVECTDPALVYGGCVVVANVTAFAYDTSGNKGVSFYLNSVWKIRDGKPFAQSHDPRQDYADADIDPAAFGTAEE